MVVQQRNDGLGTACTGAPDRVAFALGIIEQQDVEGRGYGQFKRYHSHKSRSPESRLLLE
jgi:hypothetical protein